MTNEIDKVKLLNYLNSRIERFEKEYEYNKTLDDSNENKKAFLNGSYRALLILKEVKMTVESGLLNYTKVEVGQIRQWKTEVEEIHFNEIEYQKDFKIIEDKGIYRHDKENIFLIQYQNSVMKFTTESELIRKSIIVEEKEEEMAKIKNKQDSVDSMFAWNETIQKMNDENMICGISDEELHNSYINRQARKDKLIELTIMKIDKITDEQLDKLIKFFENLK